MTFPEVAPLSITPEVRLYIWLFSIRFAEAYGPSHMQYCEDPVGETPVWNLPPRTVVRYVPYIRTIVSHAPIASTSTSHELAVPLRRMVPPSLAWEELPLARLSTVSRSIPAFDTMEESFTAWGERLAS